MAEGRDRGVYINKRDVILLITFVGHLSDRQLNKLFEFYDKYNIYHFTLGGNTYLELNIPESLLNPTKGAIIDLLNRYGYKGKFTVCLPYK